MTRRKRLVCLLTIALLLPVAVTAEHTRYWRQTDFSEFEKGTAKGVAIRSDGKLVPAPKFDSFADPNLAYVWSMRMDSKKRLYAAGGSDAKVLRFDDSGKATTVFESTELAAQTIALDSAENLYVGTSPDGKVYQVTPDGKKSVFFEPKTKYIWALAVDPQGALFVATGDTGQVFVVTPGGKGRLFYQSRERHARSLAFDSKGNLLIGTDPDGLVVRVEISRRDPGGIPEAGAQFVLYETGKAEVTSLLTDAEGNIYAAAIGDKSRAQLPPLPLQLSIGAGPQSTPSVITSQGTVVTPAQPAPPLGAYPLPGATTSGGAEVVEIGTDGSPQRLWTSSGSLVFSMGFSRSGKLLLGTGDGGAVIELEGNDVYASVANTASAQVTSLIAGPDGGIFVATANPGKIFVLGPGYEPNGSFESDTFDAKIFSRWGRLAWFAENGSIPTAPVAGGAPNAAVTPTARHEKVVFFVRSGNTSNPGDTWSPWAGPYTNSEGESVDCPPARFVQWKAVFVDTSQGVAPSILWVSLAYLPKNVAPVVDEIALQDPGVRVMGFPSQQPGPSNSVPVQLRSPRSPGANSFTPTMNPDSSNNGKVEMLPQGFEQKGYQSVLWSAHDDNDDDLLFTIYYRGEGEQNWRLLKDKLTQRYYSWDTTTMPDGAYYLKVVATDAPSNPVNQALWAERASDRWEVANTPPRIENLHAGSGILNTKASFDAVSASGPIARAQYSIDSGDWQTIFPTGLLSDAPRESYFMELPGLTVGEHTIAVQVADRFDNTTSAKFTFTVPPHAH
jgi:sugar lactone lactonase YvrE